MLSVVEPELQTILPLYEPTLAEALSRTKMVVGPVWDIPLSVGLNGPEDEVANSKPDSAAIEMKELNPDPVTVKLVDEDGVP